MSVHVCTVARGNDVASARVLAATLREQHPTWRMTTLVLPGLRPPAPAEGEPFEVRRAADLEVPALDAALGSAPLTMVAALAMPLLAADLLARGAERLLCLAPDAEVFGALDELIRLLETHDAVLVPRLTGTLPDDEARPNGRDLLDAGLMDDGCVAVRASAGGPRFAAWWGERRSEAIEAVMMSQTQVGGRPLSRIGEGSPLDAARAVFGERLAVSEDPGVDVSYWNLHERPLSGHAGSIKSGGRPLRLMRYRGFHPRRPWWLSEHASRVLVLDDPVLSVLCGRRSAALLEAGWITEGETADAKLAGGLVLDDRLRRLHAEAGDEGETFGDIETPEGAEAFKSWLNTPALVGALQGFTRYHFDVWRGRSDIQQAYPDLDGADADGFRGWLWVYGRPELGLQEPLLPRAPGGLVPEPPRPGPVQVVGYLRGNLGLGEAARAYVVALEAAGVRVGTRTIAVDPPVDGLAESVRRRTDERPFEDLRLPRDSVPAFNLLCVNADQTPELVAELGEPEIDGRYTIGSWAWETDRIPGRWDQAFDLVDEVWVYSRYVAENLARASDVPVIVMPCPVRPPEPAGARVPFELPDGFLFLFAFDFFSTLQRKNPIGLVEAFKGAFAPGEGPTLILKTINAAFRTEARERLRHAIGARPDIRLVDVTLSPGEMAALFHRADCYVSLHRSEGYGLTLAESMAIGKPVVATGFSGNTDFMTPANSYLVDWSTTVVGPEGEHYPFDGTWAEPSIEDAARTLRRVWTDQEEAARRGARAAADLAVTLSPKAVGAIAAARLARIAARRVSTAEAGEAPWPFDELEWRLRFGLDGDSSARDARALARRGVLRAIRPYTASERKLDEALVRSVGRLRLDLEAERSARERDRLRLRRLEDRVAELRARQR